VLDASSGETGATAIVVLDIGRIDELLDALAARGIDVPGDLSIIALAPDEQMARSYPALTLLDLPGRDMIALAITSALASIDGRSVPAVQLLPPRLIERRSTGAARP
jgi:DNA-binding LacI/PurR family transcriptional regulator